MLAADGWTDLQTALADFTQPETRRAAVETLLERLVASKAKRAAEEAAGPCAGCGQTINNAGPVAGRLPTILDTLEALARARRLPSAEPARWQSQ
ncbi:MAG: hypothetical protein LH480_13250 [Rubrivivax sp.]|nr:hypothetical protein [Rubrivivax sp.]